LQHAFPLDILIVPSSVISIAADGERLMCGGISLGETICLGNFKFIAGYFGDRSLSPRRGDAGAVFMGSTRSGASIPRWAMTGDSTEEFLMASSGEGGLGLPSPRRRGMGAPSIPIATTPWLKDILDIAVAQQAEISLQRRVEASVLSP
jgi:hypothetical protein